MKKMIFGNNTQPGHSASKPELTNGLEAATAITNKMPKQGYLYIPFAAEDLVDQSLGLNLLRHLKGKRLYPLIAPNQKILIEMERLRAVEITKLTEQINTISDKLQDVDKTLKNEAGWNAETLRNRVSPEVFDTFTTGIARLSQQLSVLKKMSFIHKPLSQLSSVRDKLYILGHGAAGRNILAADQAATLGQMTAKSLAEQLHACGLPKTFSDLRITACFSADSIEPLSFEADELDETSGTVSEKRRGIKGIFKPLKDTNPLALTISKEMKRLGYHNIQVTGYHGAGVTYSPKEFRARRLERGTDIRRSLVRRTF
ncbi:hypothetical protein SAMN04487787_1124 [Kosakonia sacchari]|nr:hypothetical protein SAMN04487787_1124 [Kosakonia sacchari]